jgi:hypothetical protein
MTVALCWSKASQSISIAEWPETDPGKGFDDPEENFY